MIIPFLCFHGQCEEAVRTYGSLFDFKATFLRFGQVPERGFNVPSDFENKIMFTQFKIEGQPFMACDHYPGCESTAGQTVSLNFVAEKEVIEKVFNALSKDGKIGMPFQKTLWSSWYASLTDQFGVVWQFSIQE